MRMVPSVLICFSDSWAKDLVPNSHKFIMIQAYINKKLHSINTIICITQHSGQLAHLAAIQYCFRRMKWLRVQQPPPPPPRMGYQSITRLPPSISSGFPNTSPVLSYTPGWRDALWKYSILPKNRTQWSSQGIKSNLLTHSLVHYALGYCTPHNVTYTHSQDCIIYNPCNPYTLISVCIFSILFSIHFLMIWQGEFV